MPLNKDTKPNLTLEIMYVQEMNLTSDKWLTDKKDFLSMDNRMRAT